MLRGGPGLHHHLDARVVFVAERAIHGRRVFQADAMCDDERRINLATFDALAAAYASAGRFEEAVKAARSGIDLATSAGQDEAAAQFRIRLQLYEQRKPFRQ